MRLTIIGALVHNLDRAISLLDALEDTIYTDESIGPYYSSVGSHMRHIIDFYDCILAGLQHNAIDLSKRKRDERIATDRDFAKQQIVRIQKRLYSLKDVSTDYLLHVTDDLGKGSVTVNYTFESVFVQANSHTVHHFALIAQLLVALGINVNLNGFGYNTTTPLKKKAL